MTLTVILGTSPAAAEEPIKLGFVYIMSGPFAAYGEFAKQGAELAIDEVNKAGGINGRKVEGYFEDTTGKPDVALRVIRKLVMLVEPTAGMNPEETDRMIRLIKELAESFGTTFFLTEHDMRVVISIASRIFVLYQGRLLAEGSPDDIRHDENVREAYLGGSADVEG